MIAFIKTIDSLNSFYSKVLGKTFHDFRTLEETRLPSFIDNRKHLLHGYILGVLTHTTAWGWGGDETLTMWF